VLVGSAVCTNVLVGSAVCTNVLVGSAVCANVLLSLFYSVNFCPGKRSMKQALVSIKCYLC
jgi:hypothetical protein